MDFISTGTEILKQENVLTPRQKILLIRKGNVKISVR